MTPDQYTNQEFYLDVGDGHQLYVQDWGNPKATKPILFLHGGPGAACSDKHKQNFDPKIQRVIFHDQRGCGKSTPYGNLDHNTTPNLVQDITTLADKLNLETFIICGGSWGSFLGLVYAIQNPKRVSGLVLRGIFTGAQDEMDWLDKGQFRTLFPEVWERYINNVPSAHQDDPTAYLHQQIASGDPEAIKQAAFNYGTMEYSLISLDDRQKQEDYETYDPTGMLIEMHYYHPDNVCFVPPNYVLDNASALTMPIWLIQGRYDVICAPFGAYRLHKALPQSQLIWTIAGHHGSDRANYDAVRNTLLQLTAE